MMRWKHTKAIGIVLVAALPLALAGCGSSSDDTAQAPPPMVEPDPVAVEMKAIDDAIAAAQTAVAAVNDASTDEMVMAADAAVAAAMKAIADATRITAADVSAANARLATITGPLAAAKTSREMSMDLASQIQDIEDAIAAAMTAVGAVTDDSDAATVTAADAAIAAANAAIAAAGDISNAEAVAASNRVTAIMSDLTAAKSSRTAAMGAENNRTMQIAAITEAAGHVDTSDLTDQAKIDAAEAAIAALKAALVAATDVSDADKAMYQGRVTAAEAMVARAESALLHAAQTMVLTDAVAALQAIDLSDLSTQAMIDAADAAIADLRAALAAATELSDAEKTAAMTELATASRTVMAAQGSVDTGSQMTMLSDAHEALGAIDLDNLMTQAQIDAANAAIIALDLALKAATNLTDAEKLDATVDKRVAERKVTAAETVLAENVGDQRMALTEAGIALAEIDLDDLSDQAKIDAADAAVDALQAALDGATHLSAADKAMYQTQLDAADDAVKMAQTGMDSDERMTAQRTAIMTAANMASTAVTGVSDTSTDSEVAAADAAVKAVKDAIAAAEDLSEDDAEIIKAQAVLSVIEPQLAAAKTSRTTAMAKADEDRGKANAALGKAMHDALGPPTAGGNALANIDTSTPVALAATGLTIDAAEGAGALTTNPDAEELKAGASAGALGSWMGMDYAHMEGTGNAKVTNEARVYTNQGAPTTIPFARAGHTIIAAGNPNAGMVLVEAANIGNVMAPTFTHDGTQTHPLPEDTTVFKVRGTYDGAPGEYRCTGDVLCSSTNNGSGAPSELLGTWHFKPDPGAMVSQPDDNYLYYGWWVSKDSKGMPTAASAFMGTVGTAPTLSDGVALTGSATYAGHAAGKFAINNVLNGTGNGGHFTADAMLTAKFGTNDAPNNGGVTGMIDNFRLNDGTEDPGWSVRLNRAQWGTTGAVTSTADPTNTAAEGTVWSINDNPAPESGSWGGQMYDELPGNTNDDPAGDGSNIPTTVTGTFYSEFSTIGRMVGAFGADKQ